MSRTAGVGAADASAAWEREFEQWLAPFVAAFEREAPRRWAPVYLRGLLGPGERKSVEPMAERVCPGETQQLHHFVAAAPWATEPLEAVLARVADRLVGGPDAVLIIDDTSLVKHGRHSVGVARQYCGALGKTANCQALVSLTLARGEVPVPLALRLYLPEAWTADPARRARAKVPASTVFRTKGEIALAEVDRVIAGRRAVRARARRLRTARAPPSGLTARGLTWAVGIEATQKVYPADVALTAPTKGPTGRLQKHPVPTAPGAQARAAIDALVARRGRRAFRELSWRRGTKGLLVAEFAAVRVRVADGPLMAKGQHLPGEASWLVGERRASGEVKYYLTNHPPRTALVTLARAIKARCVCEQVHQQLKEELGLDHFEGRRWLGLHHHALLTMIPSASLQHRRLQAVRRRDARADRASRRRGGKIHPARPRATAAAHPPRAPARHSREFSARPHALPAVVPSSTPNGPTPLLGASAQPQSGDSIPGAYIVLFKDDVTDVVANARQLIRLHGALETHIFEQAVKGFSVRNLPDRAVNLLEANPLVRLVEPVRMDYLATDQQLPLDGSSYQFSSLWNLDRIDHFGAGGFDGFFRYTYTGAGVLGSHR